MKVAIIGAGNNKLFALLCKEMGREDLPEDEAEEEKMPMAASVLGPAIPSAVKLL